MTLIAADRLFGFSCGHAFFWEHRHVV